MATVPTHVIYEVISQIRKVSDDEAAVLIRDLIERRSAPGGIALALKGKTLSASTPLKGEEGVTP